MKKTKKLVDTQTQDTSTQGICIIGRAQLTDMAQPFADSCDSIAARLRQANADLAHIARAFDDEFDKRYDDKVVMNSCDQQHAPS